MYIFFLFVLCCTFGPLLEWGKIRKNVSVLALLIYNYKDDFVKITWLIGSKAS